MSEIEGRGGGRDYTDYPRSSAVGRLVETRVAGADAGPDRSGDTVVTCRQPQHSLYGWPDPLDQPARAAAAAHLATTGHWCRTWRIRPPGCRFRSELYHCGSEPARPRRRRSSRSAGLSVALNQGARWKAGFVMAAMRFQISSPGAAPHKRSAVVQLRTGAHCYAREWSRF